MSSTGLLLRLNCQWHTEPKRWFNSTLVSNPLPVTHNFLLTTQPLGQPAGGKTYRCCWLESEGAGVSHLQSAQSPPVGYRVGVGGCLPLCRREVGGDVSSVMGHLPSFKTYVSLSIKLCSSSSSSTWKSFISLGNIRSLSQSIWRRYERQYSGHEWTTHSDVWP